MNRIPLADARGFAWPLERARLIRIGLALALAAVAAAAVAAAFDLRERRLGLFPERSSSVIVLDVSASVQPPVYWQIARILDEAQRTGGRYGLVFFSHMAYEALPPGSPAREVGRYARFFKPIAAPEQQEVPEGLVAPSSQQSPVYSPNPWGGVLTGGTRISTGLELAREVLEREGVEDGNVILVSDLDDDGADIPILADTLTEYVEAKVPLRVVALNAAPAHRRFFERLLGTPSAIRDAPRPPSDPSRLATTTDQERFPTWLVLAALVLLGLLTANELLCGRLVWARPAKAGAK